MEATQEDERMLAISRVDYMISQKRIREELREIQEVLAKG
jgi:hypothetical protein